jgi:hypothetical protein
MKQRSKILLGVLLVLMFVLLLAAATYGAMRYVVRRQHPLVLIHSPRRSEQFALGETLLVHATARSSAGIARMELWVDGELVAGTDKGEDHAPSPLSITEMVLPKTSGQHELIVRAFTPLGVTGQGSILIKTMTRPGEIPGGVIEAVAFNGTSSFEEPPSGADEPSPSGDQPGEPTSPGAPPPSFADESPGSSGDLFEFVFDPQAVDGETDEEPESLFVELVSLTTDADYEHVHCYMGLGEVPPRWYPDADHDQTTDEYFAKLAPNTWDIAPHFSGNDALNIPWVADQPIPIEMSCIGISSGGTDAIELGSVDPSPDPTAWDGIIRQISSAGGEGSFTLGYRVIPIGDTPGGVPLMLNPSMTPPSNLRLRGAELLWDYEPDEDEEPATRFRVFINNILVWEVPGDVRSTFIPAQAADPPCGQAYRFHVESYRDGDWSFPSNFVTASSEYGDPGCRTILLTFNTLITHNLGGDDDRDPGDVGPVDGSFEANDYIARFNGASDVGSFGDLGLQNDWEYPINGPDGLTVSSNWLGTGPAQWQIEVPPDEGLSLGYLITEYDRRGDYSYVCIANTYLETEEFIEPHEGVIPSESGQGSCEVTYSIDLVDTSPAHLGDAPPLPHLFIDQITLSASGNRPVIHFRNDGYGDWTAQDIEIRVRTTGGDLIGFYSFTGQFIHVGEIVALSHPLLEPDRPLDICVEVDPYDQVEEAFELSGAFTQTIEYCQPLPDLVITDVDRAYGTSQMHITVQNIGEAAVPDQSLSLQIQTADGRTIPGVFPAYFVIRPLEPWESTVLEWNMTAISSIDGAYTVMINPDRSIAEISEDNNTYDVPANPEFVFFMASPQPRWYPLSAFDPCEPSNPADAETQTQTLSVSVQALSPFGNRSLGSLSEEFEIRHRGLQNIIYAGQSFQFELDGTEELTATITGEARRGLSTEELGTVSLTALGAEYHWGATQFKANLEHCSIIEAPEDIQSVTIYPPDTRRYACGPWYFGYLICQREAE